MSTFRGIGARLKTQGGGSLNNLNVTTQLTTAGPLNLNSNDVLINEVILALVKDPVFLNELSSPTLRAFISNQLADVPALAASIRPLVAAILTADTLFIDSVALKLSVLLKTFVSAKLVNTPPVDFYENLALGLVPYSNLILGDRRTQIQNNIIEGAIIDLKEPTNVENMFAPIIKNYIQNDTPEYNINISLLVCPLSFTFKIPPFLFYNYMTLPLFFVSLKEFNYYKINFTPVVFTNPVGAFISKLIIKIVYALDFSLYSTLYTQSFTPSVSQVSVSGFVGTLFNGDEVKRDYYVVAYAELSEGYIIYDGTAFLDNRGISKAVNNSFILSMNYDAPGQTVKFYGYRFFDPNLLLDNIYEVYDHVIIVYYIGTNEVLYSSKCYFADLTTSYPSNFEKEFGPNKSLYYSSSINNDSSILLVKFQPSNPSDNYLNRVWYARLTSGNLDFLYNLATDINENVYVCGHYFADQDIFPLIAYNSDGTAYSPNIILPGNTCLSVGFIVKYDSRGDVLGFVTIQSSLGENICSNLSCSAMTDCIVCTGFCSAPPCSVNTFNNTVLTIPNSVFLAKLNDIDGDATSEWWATISGPGYFYPENVKTDVSGNIFWLINSYSSLSVSVYHANTVTSPAFTLS